MSDPVFDGLQDFKQYVQDNLPFKQTAFFGEEDPSQGLARPQRSIYAQEKNGEILSLWIKFGPGDFDWRRIPSRKDIIIPVPTIADLRALTGLVDGQVVSVTSYLSGWAGGALGPSGGGNVVWKSGDQSAAVAVETAGAYGAVFPPASDPSGASGAWFRTDLTSLTPFDFGAKGDATADDTIPLGAMSAVAEYHGSTISDGGSPASFRTTGTVSFRFRNVDMPNASFRLDHANIGVELGGFGGQNISNPPQFIGLVYRDGTAGQPDVRIMGARGQRIGIEYAGYVQLYCDSDGGAIDQTQGYSKFYFKRAITIELSNNEAATNPSQWINSNDFYLGRSANLVVKGTYGHNHNSFWGGVWEGNPSFDIQTGHSNHVIGGRFETSSGTINFGPDTFANTIVASWTSNRNTAYREGGLGGFSITDQGIGNFAGGVWDAYYKRSPIIEISPKSCRSYTQDTGTAYPGNVTTMEGVDLEHFGFEGLKRFQNRVIYKSRPIPVEPGVGLQVSCDQTLYRVYAYAYDADGELMTDANYPDIDTWVSTSSDLNRSAANSRWNSGFDISESNIVCRNGTIKSLQIELRSGGAPIFNIEGISIHTVSPRRRSSDGAKGREGRSFTKPMSAAPTFGYFKSGEFLPKSGGGFHQVDSSLDTTTTSAVSGSDVDVSSLSGVSVGDVMGLELDNGSVHWTTVSAIAAPTVTMTDAPPSASSSVSRVVFVGWV